MASGDDGGDEGFVLPVDREPPAESPSQKASREDFRQRALVLHPELGDSHRRYQRSSAKCLEEVSGLALAIDLHVCHGEVVRVPRIASATLIGAGIVERLARHVKDLAIDLVVVNSGLSPVQQRNLERKLHCKVIDRTGLILEIFGARARTHEGRLQVELAALTFQRSRLVRSWTHLERQRGGRGFMGGPGERQLEIDRRLTDERIAKLKKQLSHIQRTRRLHRLSRAKVPYPIVALVGYTNAGKSTLFNRLTRADVAAKDMLFTTLDPTMRQVRLPSGRQVILSDTVGFITDLPTHLVAAFRATLEEVTAADIIVHVRDFTSEDTEEEKEDVTAILSTLEISPETPHIEVLNKIDLLEPALRDPCLVRKNNFGELHQDINKLGHPLSALTGEGIDGFLGQLDRLLSSRTKTYEIHIPAENGAAMAWLYEHGHVLDNALHGKEDTGEGKNGDIYANFIVAMTEKDIARFTHLFPNVRWHYCVHKHLDITP